MYNILYWGGLNKTVNIIITILGLCSSLSPCFTVILIQAKAATILYALGVGFILNERRIIQ